MAKFKKKSVENIRNFMELLHVFLTYLPMFIRIIFANLERP